jgi:hypothetical protein
MVHQYEVEDGIGRFCSTSCEGRWRKGVNAPRWMGDHPKNPNATGHQRANMIYKELQPCEVCGRTSDNATIHRHHIDENPMNNAPENISFLCSSHHRILHIALKNIGLKND